MDLLETVLATLLSGSVDFVSWIFLYYEGLEVWLYMFIPFEKVFVALKGYVLYFSISYFEFRVSTCFKF
jgi:hypothetical protein